MRTIFFSLLLSSFVLSAVLERGEVSDSPKPRPQLNFAAALQNAGRYDEALVQYSEMLGNPRARATIPCGPRDNFSCSGHSKALANAATILLEYGDLDGYWLTQVGPDGRVELIGRIAGGGIDILEALERQKLDPDSVHNLAAAYVRAGRFDQAWKLSQKWESDFFEDGIYWMNYGQAAVGLGRCDDAKRLFRRGATIDADVREFFTTRKFACTPKARA